MYCPDVSSLSGSSNFTVIYTGPVSAMAPKIGARVNVSGLPVSSAATPTVIYSPPPPPPLSPFQTSYASATVFAATTGMAQGYYPANGQMLAVNAMGYAYGPTAAWSLRFFCPTTDRHGGSAPVPFLIVPAPHVRPSLSPCPSHPLCCVSQATPFPSFGAGAVNRNPINKFCSSDPYQWLVQVLLAERPYHIVLKPV